MHSLRPIVTGTTRKINFIYSDKDNNPIDITGSSGQLVIRKNMNSSPSITVTADITPLEGKVTFEVTPAMSDSLNQDREKATYLCGAILTLATGEIINLYQGEITVQLNVIGA